MFIMDKKKLRKGGKEKEKAPNTTNGVLLPKESFYFFFLRVISILMSKIKHRVEHYSAKYSFCLENLICIDQ